MDQIDCDLKMKVQKVCFCLKNKFMNQLTRNLTYVLRI